MKADTWQFRTVSLFYGVIVAGTLWWMFKEFVNDLVFLIPIYWIAHTRDTRSRLIELNRRIRMTHDMIGHILDNDDDPLNDYADFLEGNGFMEEADEIFERKYAETPRT